MLHAGKRYTTRITGLAHVSPVFSSFVGGWVEEGHTYLVLHEEFTMPQMNDTSAWDVTGCELL
jgi:hypothetical protein